MKQLLPYKMQFKIFISKIHFKIAPTRNVFRNFYLKNSIINFIKNSIDNITYNSIIKLYQKYSN